MGATPFWTTSFSVIADMLKFIKDSFVGHSGKPSAMRINAAFWSAGVLFCIIWETVHTGIPSAEKYGQLVLSVPAMWAVKAYQRKSETPQ
jgi:hypothetical protein